MMSAFEISPLVNGKGLRLEGDLDLAAAPRLTEKHSSTSPRRRVRCISISAKLASWTAPGYA